MRRLSISNCRLPIGVILAVAFCLLSGGCGEGGAKKAESDAASKAVTRTATDGPVQLTLAVSPAELPFTDKASVVIEVLADASVTLEVADYDRDKAHLEHQYEYRLSRGERRAAVPAPDGKLSWRIQYDLQFFAPGEFEFPPAVVKFAQAIASDGRGLSEADTKELKTESIAVRALDPNAKPLSPEELSKVTTLAPVELPSPWSRTWWIVGAVVAVAILALWFMRRGESAAPPPVVVPPHEWARRMFDKLAADGLVPRGMIQEFYYRVSDIVRGYVERRFAVSAPEMTTEEFLATAAKDGRIGSDHTGELQEFLTACDLVKYAKQIPTATEADQVLGAAKAFVDRTSANRQTEAAA